MAFAKDVRNQVSMTNHSWSSLEKMGECLLQKKKSAFCPISETS